MHPSAEHALNLISTPRSPAQLLKASQAAWNEHGYPLTYACFMALVALTDNFGEQTDGDVSGEVAVPRPPSEVILLAGRRRGEECLDMLNDLIMRVREAAQRQTQELAEGASLEDLDKNYKGNAVYLMAYIVGSGVESLVEQGEDADRVLDSVAQFLEQLSS
ncbi:hypothetical protein ACOCJ5_15395 [Knoellia sp. CPCC 206450]|uniref:hypothetical protein n=1 Tax=Knoellia tibetensis TaxID=3404798 RepID=UPI003B4305A3